MDRRTVLAISLCFLIFWGWQKYYIEPRIPVGSAQTQQANVAASVANDPLKAPTQSGAAMAAPSSAVATKVVAPQQRELSTTTGKVRVGNGSRIIEGWDLKSYRTGVSEKTPAISLQDVSHVGDGEIGLDFERPELAYLSQVRGVFQDVAGGVRWNYEDENVKISRQMMTTEGQPYFQLGITAEFKKNPPKYAYVTLTGQSHESDTESLDRHLVYWHNREIGRELLSKPLEQKQVPSPVKWIGLTNRYFLLALVNDSPSEVMGLVQPVNPSGTIVVDGKPVIPNAGRVSFVYTMQGNSITIPLKVYFGPKELSLLRAVDETLDHTIDFGWFNAFAYPLLRLMKALHQWVQNWGVAIILLTLLVKVALFPLTYKSMKSMKQMAKLQPQLQKIKEKYKDDRESLNREMMGLMKNHGYNPMAGCLPILIQMPIFFALYRVLYSSIELYHAPFMLWIHDLSAKDSYYVTPVLLTAVMYIQQKLTPMTATDPAQQKMMQFMPLMFGIFMVTLPSGLTLYMLVNALASIGQQLYLNKKLDLHPTAVPAVT